MRAIAVSKLGAPPALMDLPKPTPGPGELLVHVAAASVNPFDWKIAEGALNGAMPHRFPLVLGIDASGTVEALGEGVSRFAVGDHVLGQFLHAPVGTGTYCETTTVPETIGVSHLPPAISARDAAAVPTAGMTALQSIETLGLSKGQSLLVIGASGGVGSFAVQLAKARGMRVIALARASSVDYVRGLGATEVVSREEPDAMDRIRRSHPGGVDGLLDMASDAQKILTYASLVRKGGIVASTVRAAPAEAGAAGGYRSHNVNLAPSSALLDRLTAEIATGRVQVPVRATHPLSEGVKVLAELRKGGGVGKTVLTL
jgi:NADPH:quinone reductase-like Zn-dependent oxidoreductase